MAKNPASQGPVPVTKATRPRASSTSKVTPAPVPRVLGAWTKGVAVNRHRPSDLDAKAAVTGTPRFPHLPSYDTLYNQEFEGTAQPSPAAASKKSPKVKPTVPRRPLATRTPSAPKTTPVTQAPEQLPWKGQIPDDRRHKGVPVNIQHPEQPQGQENPAMGAIGNLSALASLPGDSAGLQSIQPYIPQPFQPTVAPPMFPQPAMSGDMKVANTFWY